MLGNGKDYYAILESTTFLQAKAKLNNILIKDFLLWSVNTVRRYVVAKIIRGTMNVNKRVKKV